MLGIIVVLLVLFILDIAAMCWGCDSRDGQASKEWERRNQRGWSF